MQNEFKITFGLIKCKDGYIGRGHIYESNTYSYIYRRHPGKGRKREQSLDQLIEITPDQEGLNADQV